MKQSEYAWFGVKEQQKRVRHLYIFAAKADAEVQQRRCATLAPRLPCTSKYPPGALQRKQKQTRAQCRWIRFIQLQLSFDKLKHQCQLMHAWQAVFGQTGGSRYLVSI
jgi:hypothetical protein